MASVCASRLCGKGGSATGSATQISSWSYHMTEGQAFNQSLSCHFTPDLVVLPHEKGAMVG